MAVREAKDKTGYRGAQGYENDAQHDADVALIKAKYPQVTSAAFGALDRSAQKAKLSALTRELAVGKSAYNCKQQFDEKVSRLAKRVSAIEKGFDPEKAYMYPERDEQGRKLLWNIDYSDGPIKGLARIYFKSVLYAAQQGAPDLLVSNCKDILRATISFSSFNTLAKYCGQGNANILDMIDAMWNGSLLRVKNRFIDGRAPALSPATTHESLAAICDRLSHAGSHEPGVRDNYYRDIQCLVMIKRENNHPCQPLEYQIAELQVTVDQMLEVKHHGGHEAYRALRATTGFNDLNQAAKNDFASPEMERIVTALLQDARPGPNDVREFHSNYNSMIDLYRNAMRDHGYDKKIENLIDNSNWYQSRCA
ncbi:MAG: hypothetical protein AAFZ18_20080 [Myxococcota bacterium]